MREERDLREALKCADWNKLLPRLGAYAEQRLRRVGWSSGINSEPSAFAVQDAIGRAIESCIAGDRRWYVDGSDDLELFLRGVIKSVIWSAKKTAIRERTTADADAGMDDPDGAILADEALAESGRSEIEAAIQTCVENDSKLEDLYLAISEGHVTREDIAERLGWSVAEVSAARLKLQRRVRVEFPEAIARARRGKKTP